MIRGAAPGAPRTGASAIADEPVAGLGFDDVPRPGDVLMARDEARFLAAERSAAPVEPSLSWFAWDRPTLSLGRLEPADAFDAAALRRAGIPCVVRPTGGRAVLHVDEWTYVALVPLDHPTLGGALAESTRALTALVATALERAYGLRCDADGGGRAAPGAISGPATCFARSFGYELTVAGRKLMGSAQRRGRRVLLQQGSLLVGPGHERIARLLAGPASDPARAALAEAALATATTDLATLLGGRPDPAPFRAALAGAWRERVGDTGAAAGAQGSGQAGPAPLDSPDGPS